MTKFQLTAPAFLQNGYRHEGSIVDLDCKKNKDGDWEGAELPPPNAKEYKGSEKAEDRGPPAKKPIANPG